MQVANVTKIGSQKKVVLAQGSPSEEALSRNLFLVITHSKSPGSRISQVRVTRNFVTLEAHVNRLSLSLL